MISHSRRRESNPGAAKLAGHSWFEIMSNPPHPHPVSPPIKSSGKSNQKKTSRKAIGSLVLGISSFLCTSVTGIIGLIIGILAWKEINNSQGWLQGKGLAIAGIITSSIGTLMIIPVLIGVNAGVQDVREAARKTESRNNLLQIALGMLNYQTATNRFPTRTGPLEHQGEANVSWRVKLLPFLGEEDLYDRYDFDQPWDSKANLALLPDVPIYYRFPNQSSQDIAEGLTVYQVPYRDVDFEKHPELRSEMTIFSDDDGTSYEEVPDGTANTILVIEVDMEKAVPWTKPDDWKFDPQDPSRDLGNHQHGGFFAAFADGFAKFIENDVPPSVLKGLFTRAGGEAVQGRY